MLQPIDTSIPEKYEEDDDTPMEGKKSCMSQAYQERIHTLFREIVRQQLSN